MLLSYSKPLGPDRLWISSDTWLSKGRDGVAFSAIHNGSQSRLRDRAGAFLLPRLPRIAPGLWNRLAYPAAFLKTEISQKCPFDGLNLAVDNFTPESGHVRCN